mmetsp:Transcript_28264/g.59128  ORF Transcript_28264/g.59128 Transcript_28264/m.59128 type:complete len:201 (-) Transcript_28264:361-963(-)
MTHMLIGLDQIFHAPTIVLFRALGPFLQSFQNNIFIADRVIVFGCRTGGRCGTHDNFIHIGHGIFQRIHIGQIPLTVGDSSTKSFQGIGIQIGDQHTDAKLRSSGRGIATQQSLDDQLSHGSQRSHHQNFGNIVFIPTTFRPHITTTQRQAIINPIQGITSSGWRRNTGQCRINGFAQILTRLEGIELVQEGFILLRLSK